MKTGAQYFVAGTLLCLSLGCHADDEAAFPYLIPSETAITNSERAESAVFTGDGCIEAGALLLPAPFGDAGMSEFVPADGTRTTCAFDIRNPDASSVALPDADEAQLATGIVQTTQTDAGGGGAVATPASPAEAVPEALPQAVRESEDVAAVPKPVEPRPRMSTPPRRDSGFSGSSSQLVYKYARRVNLTMSAADYRWFLYASVLVLVLALLALLGAVGALLYLRWFSECAILARAVNRGLRRNEFHLEYQPVFYTGSRKCIGLEVALRWKNAAYGLRGEAWYMNQLVDRRSARKIVAFVLSAAGRELGALADGRKLCLMVNLWKTYLESEQCISFIAAAAKSFASCQLVFQVKVEDLPQQLRNLARLRENKVRIAVSGVMTGTSITASALPIGVEFIKVDREVMGQEESDRLQTLQAIAAAGRQLEVAVIADGVEGSGQFHAVERAGIDLAQGFFLGKMIPAGQLPALFGTLDERQGKHVSTAGMISFV